jgi:Cu-Zn family superoxide dismutase
MIDRLTPDRRPRMKLHPASLPLVVSLLGLGCATSPAPPSYVATTLQPTAGNTAAGTVWFMADGADVRIRGRVTGLKASQEHGFHVHEKGDCSSVDAMSAGGHLNPTGKPHGPPTGEHHAGDLPALKADAAGNATIDSRVRGLAGGPTEFAGKALVVHVSPDDYTTQPTGNSGARIACGVISSTPGRDAAGNALPAPKDL